ncbi:MAG: D-alanyl-D-alanine carboxypeptidase/D-alanyl-D-alanine-endopeptidase [Myxococcales bacterium]|jgi:D-alanyl-D-alanine carboxypeptidase/D-alanyl-D-alanine-endopeptidase (penicillin-binding protein 4)|nr:D-alanyl-D-alanine carboxypeptidase/D-alanyl-D-alanine-endopeptidase [Myxococcales bacterium]MBL0196400.1 D-alanyl-D-alanine carboxypeptidase/D-alanyl-D-alanine-endopeptidase [Myxococcales bacterium]HQY64181.1 D-alanyl-D-alanine carboxypeptidase/D-alanyl-D-alanine-endopeptidase [Polyangiaceae bacterium]
MRRVAFGVLAIVALVARDASSDPPAAAPEPAVASLAVKGAAPEMVAAVHALVKDRTLRDAKIGVEVMDLGTGAVLASYGEHVALNPASNAKVFTAAAALSLLHGSFRYHTTLTGALKGAAVDGPLVLRGNGDPSLTTEDLYGLVRQLVAHGARRVDGDIVVDQRFFDGETTPPAFEQQPNEWAYFRAPVSAVAVNENTVTLSVRPTSDGQNAIATFDPPGFVDSEGAIKTRGSGADTVGLALAGSGKRLSAKLSGAVAENARLVRYVRRVEDPTLLAGYALKALLEERGVKVTGEVKLGSGSPKATVLARHESAPLSTLLYALGKQSDNFYAEMVFKTLGGERKGRPAKSADAAAVVTKWLEQGQMLEPGTVIKNGSGLFDANRVTAHGVALVLRDAWQDPSRRAEFVAQLSVGGVDGTLHKRFRTRQKHHAIRAKTGTLDDVIALSGYVLAPPGKNPLAFSIMFNKVSGRGGAARSAADELVEQLHDRLWGH